MSGRQSPLLPGEVGSVSASSSSAEAPLDSTATALANILAEVGGLRRSIQRLDERMDTVVDRVGRMETWIPNDGGDTSSDRQLDAGSIDDTDRPTITRLDPALTHAAVTSSIDPTRDLPPHLIPRSSIQPPAARQVDSGGPESTRAGSERAVSEHAASPSRPPRPDRAAGRSATPHELKPPQVQAFRALTSKEKAAIQRLSALLGRPVRDCLDGDTSLDDLLADQVPGSNGQPQPRAPSSTTSPARPIPPTTPPDSPPLHVLLPASSTAPSPPWSPKVAASPSSGYALLDRAVIASDAGDDEANRHRRACRQPNLATPTPPPLLASPLTPVVKRTRMRRTAAGALASQGFRRQFHIVLFARRATH
ncbi:hypothetical protein A4X03_0g8406 [Tilletia caries]|uniref:Uncharacterized protein n=1 Tax=Tilletia caries TaxID=13290 RepID=A0A8T8SIG3_9BASI|nr:hypothetical protein A4X03_0g8406 [Tilletia caries]